MSRVVFFIVVFIIANSFIVLEEETIVLLASIIWLDAAGSAIREALTSELEGKGDKIKEVFIWYLSAQQSLEEVLIKKHELRQNLVKNLVGMYEIYIDKLLDSILQSYAYNYVVVSNQERKNDIVERGMLLVNELSKKEMQLCLGYPGEESMNNSVNNVWLDKAVKGSLLTSL